MDINIFEYLAVADKVILDEPNALGDYRLTVVCEHRDYYAEANIEYKAIVQNTIGRGIIIHCAVKLDDALLDQILEDATSEIFLH